MIVMAIMMANPLHEWFFQPIYAEMMVPKAATTIAFAAILLFMCSPTQSAALRLRDLANERLGQESSRGFWELGCTSEPF